MKTSATLLVSCSDRKGLVAALSQFLYHHGANILEAQQHTDTLENIFFQRIRFDMSELDISRPELESLLGIECQRFNMRWRISYSDHLKRIAIFVSRRDHCLYDLLLRRRLGELNGEIALVISNHPDLKCVADQFGVPYHHFPISFENKVKQETQELEILERERVDLVVLARYMQILTENFVKRYPEHIINIHNSFLPAFKGSAPYQQARQRGVKLIGATAHYVTDKLDDGPIITQDVVECSHRDSVEDLVRKGRDIERIVLSKAVRAHLDDRVLLVHQNRTVVF